METEFQIYKQYKCVQNLLRDKKRKKIYGIDIQIIQTKENYTIRYNIGSNNMKNSINIREF
jgi:hypothetical protein